MAKHIISKRLVFKQKQHQRLFLLKVKRELGFTWKELSILSGVVVRTITDWARGKLTMSADAARILSKKSRIPLPASSHIKPWGDHLKTIASLGGNAVYKKYGHIGGNLSQRTQKWLRWFNTTGKFLSHLKRKNILFPGKNVALAEFVGIMIGDGGISKRQIFISLNSVDDHAYSLFVCRLLFKLFGIKPSIRKRKDAQAIDIYISRTNLVNFCQKIGLKIGNKIKQGLDIPSWIRNKTSFQCACIRGLIDTDGCVFTHTYIVGGTRYSYKKIDFTTASKPLLISIYSIFENMGFHPRIARGRSIRFDSIYDVKKYFKIINSHNPKHLKRYRA